MEGEEDPDDGPHTFNQFNPNQQTSMTRPLFDDEGVINYFFVCMCLLLYYYYRYPFLVKTSQQQSYK